MRDYIRLLRPKHIIKNILVLLPLVFSGRLTSPEYLWRTLGGFAAFSALASIVYIINDIRDAERDRQHPKKRNRPIASGAVPVHGALLLAAVLAVIVAALGLICRFPLEGWLCLTAYLVLNVGYSMGLKDIPILDIAILVAGFLLRVLFGALVTGVEISGWLYLTVTSLSFYLGLGKRRGELKTSKEDSRRVLQFYSYDFLDKNMQICLALSIVFYSLWSVDSQIKGLMWTVPLVICVLLKYSMTVEGSSDGDPVEVIYQDRVLIIMAAVFAIIVLALLYL